MTIDKAIKHCIEVAEKQEITAKSNLMEIDKIKADGILRLYDADEYESCMKCAAEHRQLAEWLRELRKIKHLFSVTEKLFKANFRGGLIDVVDGYDILFSEHKQLREIFEEVNSDE